MATNYVKIPQHAKRTGRITACMPDGGYILIDRFDGGARRGYPIQWVRHVKRGADGKLVVRVAEQYTSRRIDSIAVEWVESQELLREAGAAVTVSDEHVAGAAGRSTKT